MDFNKHLEVPEGSHAFLSASSYHWLRYDRERLIERFNTYRAAQRGTELHEFARTAIKLRQKLPRAKKTLNMYVNDAIGYRMNTEQILFYSWNAFGTADAISFRANQLRIHDLKTGATKTSLQQLEVYAAFFCLEYDVDPSDIEIELRIYQNDDIIGGIPETQVIVNHMKVIVEHDKLLNELRSEEL